MLVDPLRVTTRDGYMLDGMLLRSSAAKKLGLDAVCFVHGTGGNFYSSSMFDLFAQKFLDLGCPVLRVNTRGHDGISTAATSQFKLDRFSGCGAVIVHILSLLSGPPGRRSASGESASRSTQSPVISPEL